MSELLDNEVVGDHTSPVVEAVNTAFGVPVEPVESFMKFNTEKFVAVTVEATTALTVKVLVLETYVSWG
jgi:hypothetical protein